MEPSTPYMPGYGVTGENLLPWSWAEEHLAAARNYWVSSVWPDGRPHAMPVWGAWHQSAVWFTSGGRSRKVQNLRANPRCVVTTEDAVDPVVVEGIAEVVTDLGVITELIGILNAKYEDSYTVEFLDPAVNATVRVLPQKVFALRHDDFTGSPTRWTLP